jgi:hypothetical protein
MKKLLLFSLCAFSMLAMIGSPTAKAQVQVTVGTQTSQLAWQFSPFIRWYDSFHHQYIVTAAEMIAGGGAPGNIKSIAFNMAAGVANAANNYTIRMKNTAATNATAAHDLVGLTEVFSPKNVNSVQAGWNTMTFDRDFEWDGSSNILIDFCAFNPCGTFVGILSGVWGSTVTGSAAPMNYYYADCTQPCGTTTSYGTYSLRPMFRFDLQPAGIRNYFPKGKSIVGLPDSSILKYNTLLHRQIHVRV